MKATERAGAVRLGPAAAGRCRRRVHLEHDPDADRTARRPENPGQRLRRESLATHRQAVHDRLMRAMTLCQGATFSAGAVPAARPGSSPVPGAFWRPVLESDTRYAQPDLLLPASAGGYLPVLIRGHRTRDPGTGLAYTELDYLCGTAPRLPAPQVSRSARLRRHHEDALALAHVHRLLEQLHLVSGELRGGVIGFGGPAADPDWDDGAVIAWHDLTSVLDEYDARFADRLAVARAAAGRATALAAPSRVAECRQCPWWTVCGPELTAAHDVSLLAAGADVSVFRAAGARTYDDVAAMDEARIATLPLTAIPASEARARARAMAAGLPAVRRNEILDPVRADVELDIDMESYSDDGAYLWGTYLSGSGVARLNEQRRQCPEHAPHGHRAGGYRTCNESCGGTAPFTEGYRPFVSWEQLGSPATARNFVAFWEYLVELRRAGIEAGLSFAAYCYSHAAEERWLYGTPARFPDEPGMPSRAEVREFCRSSQWVDLFLEVKRLLVVPGSMRLKSVAAIAGFAWRDAEPGGENSMAWYRLATGRDAENSVIPADVLAANRARILRYNEDDVKATLALRQWMSSGAYNLPTVGELG